MATITNQATLSYNGGSTNSNIATAELVETLALTKTAVGAGYDAELGRVTYVVTATNSGSAPFTGLTLTDNLGAYSIGTQTVYPLSYRGGSLLYYITGTLQTAPTVTAGPPMSVSGISIPAGATAVIVYDAELTNAAPLSAASSITNKLTH